MPFDDEPTLNEWLVEPTDEVNSIARHAIGAMIAVHTALGPGLSEVAYENALEIEFKKRGLRYARQFSTTISYEGQPVGGARLDFLVEECLILELKSVDAISPAHRRTVLQYLRMTGLQLALLVNFNVMALKEGIKRIVLTKTP